jgi:CubicO group peptidase (beta-lactamase class C family)
LTRSAGGGYAGSRDNSPVTHSPHPQLTGTIDRLLGRALAESQFTAAVCRVAIDGRDAATVALGTKAAVGDDGEPIPQDAREQVDDDTLFDLASVTKVFSAHTLLSLVERGALSLDDPVGSVLPEYRAGDKAAVTLRHLLTHTSGLLSEWRGWSARLLRAAGDRAQGTEPFRHWPLDDRDELIADLLSVPLEVPPGTRWEYSDAGFNTAMVLAERATGERWPVLVAAHTLAPLRLDEATFTPDRSAAAATEYQPQYGRGVVRGVVHDEASWSLGGASANAGMFASAGALLRFGEQIRSAEGWVRGDALWRDRLDAILGPIGVRPAPPFGESLGLRIGETVWMSGAGRESRGHTGFTGTSLQVDRGAKTTVVLLTNQVHPHRDGPILHPLRAAIAEAALHASAR